MLIISVLDHDFERMNACEAAVKQAIKKVGIEATVTKMSEPPYLFRLNIWGRLPAIEIEGKVWSKKGENAFTSDEVVRLLQTILPDKKACLILDR